MAAFQCNKLQQLQSQLNSDHFLSVLSGVLTCIFCCQSSYKNVLKPVLLHGSPVEQFKGCALWQGGTHVHTPSEINDKRQTVLWKWFFEMVSESSAKAEGTGELPLNTWTAHGRSDLFKVYKDLRPSAKCILIPSLTKGKDEN